MPTVSRIRSGGYFQTSCVISLAVLWMTSFSAGQQTGPQMISPVPGSTLSASLATFTWSPVAGASEYSLMVGTAKGLSDIHPEVMTSATQQPVSRIPTDGSTVYVRLGTSIRGAAFYSDYVYTAQPNPVPVKRLAPCQCIDLPRLKDRLAKLQVARNIVTDDLLTQVNESANQQSWAGIQGKINSALAAMTLVNTTQFADTSLFNGNGDPFCGVQMISAGQCLDESYAVHQRGHDASCAAGKWRWQTPWTEGALLEEEAAALQAEISSIQETIKQLDCGGSIATCPQFMLIVQNITSTAVNAGGLTEQSSRSLNGQQGIPVPLVFYGDGTFEGFGSGVDAGSAAGASPGEVVRSRFGHMQAVEAFGQLYPGNNCASQPCVPDAMRLVLVGGPSQQITEMHARGWVNRDMNRTTPTGAARLEFNLPAYVGSTAQQTFFATPILNSYLTVQILQSENGAAPLPQQRSLLQALQQCKVPANGSVK